MQKPKIQSTSAIDPLADPFDLIKQIWAGKDIPGISMMMPALSVGDVEKQIANLKAVESWLTLNMAMLRGTIQTLEMQSATLSTLQSISETLSTSAPVGAQAPASSTQDGAPFPSTTIADPTFWWSMLQNQFALAVSNVKISEAPPPVKKSPPTPCK